MREVDSKVLGRVVRIFPNDQIVGVRAGDYRESEVAHIKASGIGPDGVRAVDLVKRVFFGEVVGHEMPKV